VELRITRLPSDEACYLVDSGRGSVMGMEASELKTWMFDIGLGDATVAAVLDMSPNESMSFTLGKKAA